MSSPSLAIGSDTNLEENMTQAQMNRKITKPLMERRRRQRINNSLSELKSLILDHEEEKESSYCGPSSASKLEKADILEMTVRYIRRRQRNGSAPESYTSGYLQCASEISRFLSTACTSSNDVRTFKDKLESHVRDNLHVASSRHLLPATDMLSDGGSVCSDGECSGSLSPPPTTFSAQCSPTSHLMSPASSQTFLSPPSSSNQHYTWPSSPPSKSNLVMKLSKRRLLAYNGLPSNSRPGKMWRPW